MLCLLFCFQLVNTKSTGFHAILELFWCDLGSKVVFRFCFWFLFCVVFASCFMKLECFCVCVCCLFVFQNTRLVAYLDLVFWFLFVCLFFCFLICFGLFFLARNNPRKTGHGKKTQSKNARKIAFSLFSVSAIVLTNNVPIFWSGSGPPPPKKKNKYTCICHEMKLIWIYFSLLRLVCWIACTLPCLFLILPPSPPPTSLFPL